jgi:hypothetical protein
MEQTAMSKSTDITTLLGDLDAGVFAQRLGAALNDTALGVCHTGKKGRVTITLDLSRTGDSSQVLCTHQIKYARPTDKGKATEEHTTSTPLHVLKGGLLSLFPEKQDDMFRPAGTDAAAERRDTAH